ncbi:probable WRKY transcription factor 41 [Chenopodium quinoa]|uniref:WRKY domain-containing protein n=1 Tax=Chenopodium quinoa TaxID=63459 RepID=A0A803KZK6_CHEQI|nr:probable WRKY transcription factor 41 [Chenopodium quinoa]
MEEVKGFDRRAHLINELLQGMEFAKQLRSQILNPTNNSSSSSSSNDDYNSDQVALNNSLLEKMLSSFDKTITIAKKLNIQIPQDPSTNNLNHRYAHFSESSHSLAISSPKSETSHNDFSPSKKRKSMMPKWTKTVQIGNEGVKGLEGALEDGYSWRKYGQKEILRAKFPRGYYRCTHRHTKGCAATKQVQRSDEDPSIYQIMYRGEHTCAKGAQLVQAQSKAQFQPMIPAQLINLKTEPQPLPSPNQNEIYVGLSPEGDLKVEPEQEPVNYAQIFRSFSFTSTHLQTDDPNENYMLSFSPAFGSPTTSESNYIPVSPYRPTNSHIGLTVQTSETENNEGVSGPNSVSNSPVIGDFEFPIDDLLDFNGNFPFEL